MFNPLGDGLQLVDRYMSISVSRSWIENPVFSAHNDESSSEGDVKSWFLGVGIRIKRAQSSVMARLSKKPPRRR